jgi:chromosome partitioning protein
MQLSFPALELAESIENAVAIAMQKGGVGKTLTAVNVATAAARQGKRVRLVDMDPQASLTLYFKHIYKKPITQTMYNLLVEGQLIEPIRLSRLISLLPANIDLAAANQVFTVLPTTKQFPNKILARCLAPYAQDVDLLIIDCPPSLDLLTVNGLVAARRVVIVVSTEEMAEDALPKITNTVKAVRTNITQGANPQLEVICMLPSQYNTRGNSSPEVLQSIKDEYSKDYYIYPEPVLRREAYQKAVKLSADVGAIDGELGAYWDRFTRSMILQLAEESQVAL